MTRHTFVVFTALLLPLPAALSAADPRGAIAPAVAPNKQELPAMTSRGAAAIHSVTPNRTTVSQFEKFELTLDMSGSYDNPFAPEQVDLTAEFITPSGKKLSVPGFFYQPYRNRNENDDKKRPILEAVGAPCWLVRFTPTETGGYEYSLRLKNHFVKANEEVKWGPGRFVCTPSTNHGFVRVSPVTDHYFQFDDGTPFFAVGQNLQNDWLYYFHFRLLAEAGCNAVRAWLFCHYTWLEWTFKPDISYAKQGDPMRSYAGAGKYNQRIAWIADHHLDQCGRDGLRVMVTLGNGTGGGELSEEGTGRGSGKYSSWSGHPYNLANGGWLDRPEKFWTDERARNLYKQRLRYLVARYSYSTSVWAWEFWNELGEARPEIVAWHREMGDYLRGLDPNRHLITSSTWQLPEKFDEVWNLPQMDFTQTHIYQSAQVIHRGVERALRVHPGKPHIVGEGGGPPPRSASDSKEAQSIADPSHVEFHNAIWAAPMSGAAGTTLPWWWRERVEPDNLFWNYTAVARFAKGEPWASMRLQSAEPLRISLAAKPSGPAFSPVVILPAAPAWGSKAPQNRFAVQPDGTVPGIEDLRGTLFGSKRAEWRNPPVLAVNFPLAGRFTAHVAEASHGILEIVLDGAVVLRSQPLGQSRRNVEEGLTINIPAGPHEIELHNAGSDFVKVSHILLTNYRDTAKYPDLDIYAVQSDQAAFLWLHLRLNDWAFLAAGFKPEPVIGATAELTGLADDVYRVEWWDTYKGEVTGTEQRESTHGRLQLPLPAFRTDIACKIKRAR
jgi:hypothetical protein